MSGRAIIRGLFSHLLKNLLDVLNKVRQNYDKESKSAGPQNLDPAEEIEQSRHVAKYMFPRQHGLESPFRMSTIHKDTHRFPDYLDREAEIKGKFEAAKYHKPPKTWKTPRRLKEILPLIDQLAWRHYKCRYALLRDHACPSKVTSFLSLSHSGLTCSDV